MGSMLTVEEFAKAAADVGTLTGHEVFAAIREARLIDDELFRTLFLQAALDGGQIDWRKATALVLQVLERAFVASFPQATEVSSDWSIQRHGYRLTWRGGPLTDLAVHRFGFLRNAIGFVVCEDYGISMGKPQGRRSVEMVDGLGISPLWITFGNRDEIRENTDRMVAEINEMFQETTL